jgi:hypothetical protein
MIISNFAASLGGACIRYIDANAILQFIRQIYSHEIVQLYLPWIGGIIAILILSKMVTGVRMRKEGIVMVALFVQLFLPDPFADRSPKTEQVVVKKSKRKHTDNKHHPPFSD